MKLKDSKNVFIDSEINSVAGGELVRLNFPQSSFSCTKDEKIRLVLTSFEMRRNFYSVNQTNNTMYWFDATGPGSYTPFVISPGNYLSYNDLSVSFLAAVNTVPQIAAAGGATIAVNVQQRRFVLTMPVGLAAGSRFVSFQVKVGTPPTNVSENGLFNDSSELLGLFRTSDGFNAAEPVDAFSGETTGGAVQTTQTTPFVVSLNTLEAIYIRTNLDSSNFQTFGFERGLPNQSGLTPSSIFARIPIPSTTGDQFISFEDTNDLFVLNLNQNQISQGNFGITDDKNRLIPVVRPGQATSGNLNFKMVVRFEVYTNEMQVGDRVLKPSDFRGPTNLALI